MSKPLELVGKKFNRLTVLRQAEDKKRGHIYWVCLCECGNECVVGGSKLTSGYSKSCGCLISDTTRARSTKHGSSPRNNRSREYRAWRHAKTRCDNPNYQAYSHYGGKGIVMCTEWRDSFAKFMADMGTCPKGYQLDRVDNDLGYFKENCRWVSSTEQARNRGGIKLDKERVEAIRADSRRYREIAKDYGISEYTVGSVKRKETWK